MHILYTLTSSAPVYLGKKQAAFQQSGAEDRDPGPVQALAIFETSGSMGSLQAPTPSAYGWTSRPMCVCALPRRGVSGVRSPHWNSSQTSCAVSFTNGSCRPSRRARRGAQLVRCQAEPPKVRFARDDRSDPDLSCGESVMVLPACSLPILSNTGGSCQGSRNFWQASLQLQLMHLRWPW